MASNTFLVVIALCFLLNPGSASAQTVSELAGSIRTAVEENDSAKARHNIEQLKKQDPEQFRLRQYEYLQGRLAEETSNFGEAISHYSSLIQQHSQLSQYAHWRLARLARTQGDLVLEREHLRRLIGLGADSLLLEAARLRLLESLFESEDFNGVSSNASLVAQSQNVAIAREGLVLLARAQLRLGKTADARGVLKNLLMQMPDASRPDDFALAAVRELDVLDKGTTQPEAEHLLRASVYQFNRDFAAARVHYQAVIDANPQSGTVPNATFQIGRGFYQERQFDDAIKFFKRVVDQFPQSPSGRDALGSLAASYVRLKKHDEAVEAYKLFITRFPEGPNLDRSYLNLIDALHEAGRYSEALTWVPQARARFKNDLGEALALFAQLRIHLAQGTWADVIRDADELLKLSDLGGVRVGGGTSSAEVSFLRAFALEQLGRTEEAISAYLAISDGRNEYYGERSTQRLLQLGGNERARAAIQNRFSGFQTAARSAMQANRFEEARIAAQNAIRLTKDQTARSELIEILKRAYSGLPKYKLPVFQLRPLIGDDTVVEVTTTHRALGERLFQLGLYDEAIPELLASTSPKPAAPGSTPSFSNEDYSVAVYSLRGGLAYRSVRFAEQLWRTMPGDYVLEAAPRDLVELLFPKPYPESLIKHTQSRNLDPRFVLSIIRTESRYQPDVKSVAAARGMMQFIPSTANEIAAQLKLTSFTQDDLYLADTAILFGSQYLANLFQLFPQQPQAVAGSYNGGEDNLARWITRSRSNEPDRYVPEIGFSQSKDYVYKVMTSYRNYQSLYDSQLQALTK